MKLPPRAATLGTITAPEFTRYEPDNGSQRLIDLRCDLTGAVGDAGQLIEVDTDAPKLIVGGVIEASILADDNLPGQQKPAHIRGRAQPRAHRGLLDGKALGRRQAAGKQRRAAVERLLSGAGHRLNTPSGQEFL
nr:hypothetical protein [Sinorhizobium fredii]